MPIRHYPTMHAYVDANRRTRAEYDAEVLPLLEGALPPDLVGTLLRNGNGHFEQHGVPYEHLFDGDGMVARFRFDGQGVTYRNRYVRTEEFVAEEKAGRMLYRSFGTNLPGGLRANFGKTQFKNTANTSLVEHGGNLPNDAALARFVRFHLDLGAGTVSRQLLSDYAGELPEINPTRVGQPYRYAWAVGWPPSHPLLFDHLIKLDVQTGTACPTPTCPTSW